MSEMETEEPTADFEHYVAAVRQVTEEFRDLLSERTAKLTKALHEPNKWGAGMTMSEASNDPQHAAYLHRLRMGCDHFLNLLNDQY